MTDKITVRSVIVSGMGVFSDGYNLYSIALVTYTLVQLFKLSNAQEGLLVAASYFGAAFSALLFGVISDVAGRKRMYGIDVLLMALGSIFQAVSQNYTELLLSRFLVGMGVGADYVLSPIIVAENVNPKRRGMAMILTFAFMWGLGAVVAAFVLQMTQLLGVADSLAWRITLGLGAVPAISVFLYRRKIAETLFFLSRVKPEKEEVELVRKEFGINVNVDPDTVPFTVRLRNSVILIAVASVLWLLYDVYSSTFAIYGPITIAYNLGLNAITFTYLAQFGAGIPGQVISMLLVDKLGRKKLIVVGYAGVAVWLAMYSLLLMDPGLFGFNFQVTNVLKAAESLKGEAAVLGMAFYMLNYLFAAIGPASIIGSGMVTPELVPTKVRGTGQAISVFADRLVTGFVVGYFPTMVASLGLGFAVAAYSLVALVSAIITLLLVPEMKGKGLEVWEISASRS